MPKCQFGRIASRESVFHEECTTEATHEAVDSQARILNRVQRPVCARHARFLASQAFWVFPAGDGKAQSLDAASLRHWDESRMSGS